MAAVLNRVRTLARFAENKRKYDEGCASFTADTWVHTPQGLKAIQQLNAGDRIYTRDEHHYSQQISTIERTFGRTAPGYYELNIAGTLIQATPEHPFWVQGRGWVNAVNLKPGIVLSAWSGDVVLDEVRYINQAVPVYNFKVTRASDLETLPVDDWSAYRPADTRKKTYDKDLNHRHANYFVSPLKLWVHNQNNDVCDLSQRRGQNEKRQVDEILDGLPNNKRERFAKLLDSNPDFKSFVLNDLDLAGAWNVLDDAGFDTSASTNLEYLKREQNNNLWTSTRRLNSAENALDHFNRHKNKFDDVNNLNDYLDLVYVYTKNTSSKILIKLRQNGDILKYDPEKNIFIVMDRNGTPRTMFKPSDGIEYWNRQ